MKQWRIIIFQPLNQLVHLIQLIWTTSKAFVSLSFPLCGTAWGMYYVIYGYILSPAISTKIKEKVLFEWGNFPLILLKNVL